MFNRLSRSDGFLSPHAWPPDTARNEAEAPAPSHSPQGTMFRLGIVCKCPAQDTPQTAKNPGAGQHDWRGRVVRDQHPLYVETGYRDLIGGFIVKPARVDTVLSARRYQGQLPLEEQPTLDKPFPWSDPSRGAP